MPFDSYLPLVTDPMGTEMSDTPHAHQTFTENKKILEAHSTQLGKQINYAIIREPDYKQLKSYFQRYFKIKENMTYNIKD